MTFSFNHRRYSAMVIRQSKFNRDVLNDELSYRVIGCALAVHEEVGCGLLESAYEEFFCYELVERGISVVRQVGLPARYKNAKVELGYRPDLVIEGALIVELKTVPKLLPVHDAQLLTYLRLSGLSRGLLINFHAHPLKQGIRRLVLSPLRQP
jgi:GxxExxY protein